MTRHKHTFQLSFIVSDGVDCRLIIHLTFQVKLLKTVFRGLEFAEVNNAAGKQIAHLFDRNLTVEGVVFQKETTVEHLFTTLNVKGLAGTFVDIGKHTVVVVVQHVEQRRVEDGVITYQQLTDFLLSTKLLRDIMLDTHNRCGYALVVATDNRDGYLIVQTL